MNDADREIRAMEIAAEALEQTSLERPAFLNEACGSDFSLRTEVESLLRFEQSAQELVAKPAFEAHPHFVLAASAAAPRGSLQSGQMLGHFRIRSLLGEGGMGEVYLAEDPELDRLVAIKLVKLSVASETLRRHFGQEKRILAGLNNAHIARLYGGAVADDGRPYLVMEYVEGERVDVYCRDHQLPLAERLALFRKVCVAVSHAHQHLVIHRDLKPANIRVTPAGEPKLLDFGIAKLIEPEGKDPAALTVTMLGAMTPEYASPEQLRGETITTASDVYSLGVVLYELLTGQRAYQFAGNRHDQLTRAICEQDLPRPSTSVNPHTCAKNAANGGESPDKWRRLLAGDLDNIVAKAVCKEPERRYASVAQFSEDIRRHCEGLPVLARKDTPGYRTGKFVRRNKLAVAAGGLVALSLIGGLVTTSWQARVVRQERDTARVALRQAQRLDDFLQNLLRSADPATMGKDVKVVQVLDAAGKNLDHDLADEPEILARAHESIAFAYQRLGQIEPSFQHMQAALNLRRRLHGKDDPDTMRAELWMAGGFGNQGNYREAERLVRQALAGRLRQSPPDAYWTARTTDLLGAILGQTGRPVEAEKVLGQSLAFMRTARGENSREFTDILFELGWTKLSAGRPGEAEADLRRAIALDDVRDPHGVDAIAARRLLATCLIEEERLPEAEQVLQRVDADTLRLLGGDGMPFAWAHLIRAYLDFAKGDYPSVIEGVSRPLELITAGTPNDHVEIVGARGVLGLALTRTGRATDGEPYLRLACSEGQQVEDPILDLTIGNPAAALGECLFTQGRYEEAEPLLLAGYEKLKTRLDAQQPVIVRARKLLHNFYMAWQKPDRAEPFR